MKKTFFLFSLSLLFSSSSWCRQWLIFHTYYTGYNHKFIAFEKENPETGKVEVTDVYGNEEDNSIAYEMKYLADGTRYTFFLQASDDEWQKATSYLAKWKDGFSGIPSDKDCDSLMKLMIDTLRLKKSRDYGYSMFGAAGELKEMYVTLDDEGMITLSKAIVNSRYKIAKLSGDSARLFSASLTDAFIWQMCFPQSSVFDNEKHLVLSSSGSKSQKAELFITHKYASGGMQKAVVIFYTNDYTNGKKEDCHACYPVMSVARFVYKNNKWVLDNFIGDLNALSGGWGMGPNVSFGMKNGKNYLKASYADMHFGDVSEGTTYYNLDTFKEETGK